jgi:class I fructose-bisphosphate aldolase
MGTGGTEAMNSPDVRVAVHEAARDDAPWSAGATAGAAGKQYRMGRIFGEDGRTVVLPLDHGLMLGRVSGLEDPVELLKQFFRLPCDGFLLGPGVTRRTAGLFGRRDAPARLLTLDTYWRGSQAGKSVLTSSIASAAALGIDGVKLLMPWDVPPTERAALSSLIGGVVGVAEVHGLPVMVEPICLGTLRREDAIAIEADGCRMAAELGADIIKVAYPDDAQLLAQWCSELGLPVVILGGPGRGTAKDLCAMVDDAMGAGARGITIGRRVWQRPIDEATKLLGELAAIVHRRPVRLPQ